MSEEFPAHHRGWGIGMLGGVGAIGYGFGALLYGAIEWLPFGWRALYALGDRAARVPARVRARAARDGALRGARRERRGGTAARRARRDRRARAAAPAPRARDRADRPAVERGHRARRSSSSPSSCRPSAAGSPARSRRSRSCSARSRSSAIRSPAGSATATAAAAWRRACSRCSRSRRSRSSRGRPRWVALPWTADGVPVDGDHGVRAHARHRAVPDLAARHGRGQPRAARDDRRRHGPAALRRGGRPRSAPSRSRCRSWRSRCLGAAASVLSRARDGAAASSRTWPRADPVAQVWSIPAIRPRCVRRTRCSWSSRSTSGVPSASSSSGRAYRRS